MTTELAEPTGSPQEYGFPEKPTVREMNTWKLQEAFFFTFRQCGAINVSASEAGHSVESYYHWQNADVYMFQKRLDLAKAAYLEKCVTEIDRRAFDGIDKPIYYKGILVDTIKDYSDNLAMFRTKFLEPGYRDNFKEISDLSAIVESLAMLKALGTPRIVEGTSKVVAPSVETEE